MTQAIVNRSGANEVAGYQRELQMKRLFAVMALGVTACVTMNEPTEVVKYGVISTGHDVLTMDLVTLLEADSPGFEYVYFDRLTQDMPIVRLVRNLRSTEDDRAEYNVVISVHGLDDHKVNGSCPETNIEWCHKDIFSEFKAHLDRHR